MIRDIGDLVVASLSLPRKTDIVLAYATLRLQCHFSCHDVWHSSEQLWIAIVLEIADITCVFRKREQLLYCCRVFIYLVRASFPFMDRVGIPIAPDHAEALFEPTASRLQSERSQAIVGLRPRITADLSAQY